MKTVVIATCIIAAFSFSGCWLFATAIIADNAAGKTDAQRKIFLEDFERRNTERVRAGLPSLDKCKEMYMFDTEWAKSEADCSGLIDSLRGKDKWLR